MGLQHCSLAMIMSDLITVHHCLHTRNTLLRVGNRCSEAQAFRLPVSQCHITFRPIRLLSLSPPNPCD